jgi:hypothetical protein
LRQFIRLGICAGFEKEIVFGSLARPVQLEADAWIEIGDSDGGEVPHAHLRGLFPPVDRRHQTHWHVYMFDAVALRR